MAPQKPPVPKSSPALYELRHLRRALSRLEDTHATTSPVIENLKRNVVNRICELETQLGSTERIEPLTAFRNT
ncbi:MAG TPA: hypothetical protein VK574_11635 [Terracidiphilus sp.]|jgi:hypothetical protein|nr:hypothetical protein [Terracidiphilus sp.]